MTKFFTLIFNIVKIFLKINIIKTLYFNFKVLPFNQAKKLPIHIYGKVIFENITGEFKIISNKICTGMIVFGGNHEIVVSSIVPTRIYNSGKICFEGKALFGKGINIMVWKYGKLSIGENFSIGSDSRIICFREINFMRNVLISWETQFFDTDFHFIKYDDIIKDNCGKIFIEDNVWIGSRTSVLKNSILPINCIVASNSVCSGDYKEKYGDSFILAGIPAKQIKHNVSYIKDKREEMRLFEFFASRNYVKS